MAIHHFFLILLSFLTLILSTSANSQNEASGIALIAPEYIDSKILFITSADGKIYAYDMEKHALKWLADISTTLQEFIKNKDMSLDEKDFVLLPSRDGKLQIYLPGEGFQKYEKKEVQEGMQNCFNSGRIKYFSKMQEKILLLDLNKGNFWDLEDGLMHLDPNRMENFGVVRIKQYKYSAIDFQTMKEQWTLRASDIDFYTYFQFLNHGNIPNSQKLLQSYQIACKSGNVIEISKANDKNFLRSIETEEEVIGVHSLDSKVGFFSLKIDIVEEIEIKDPNFAYFIQKAHVPRPCRPIDSQGLVVYSEHHEGYGEGYCTQQTEETGSQIAMIPIQGESTAFDCIRSYINSKKAMQLPSYNLSEKQPDVILYLEDTTAKDNEKLEKDIYSIVLVIGGMGIAAITGISIERRRKSRNKRSISTEVDASINGGSSTTGSAKETSSSAKENGSGTNSRDGIPKTKEKKTKKREFEIFTKEILGMGSQGTVVFQGEFQGKNVAVKRFLKCYIDLARSEISVLMHAEHPNIIRYYLYEEDQEFIYLILERCMCSVRNFVDYFKRGDKSKDNESEINTKGTVNYRDAIRKVYKERQITSELTRKFLLDCASGLQYLHNNGIVHRDIKPENILISYGLDAKLADFGISRTLKVGEEHFLTEAGSFGWKAPEMLRKVDMKSKAVDIFSLGCTFYYFYSRGSHPFGEMHEREINILNSRYQMIFSEDFDLENLIKNMITINPVERYTIEEVLNHPYFWDAAKKLAFIQELSDYIESTDPKLGKKLEEYCQNKQAISVPWAKSLDPVLIKDLTSFRFYDFKSVKELLRVIRNKKNHYYELSEETQVLLGRMPTGVWNYFNTRFPRLFIHAYIFCRENNVALSVLS